MSYVRGRGVLFGLFRRGMPVYDALGAGRTTTPYEITDFRYIHTYYSPVALIMSQASN